MPHPPHANVSSSVHSKWGISLACMGAHEHWRCDIHSQSPISYAVMLRCLTQTHTCMSWSTWGWVVLCCNNSVILPYKYVASCLTCWLLRWIWDGVMRWGVMHCTDITPCVELMVLSLYREWNLPTAATLGTTIPCSVWRTRSPVTSHETSPRSVGSSFQVEYGGHWKLCVCPHMHNRGIGSRGQLPP